MLTREISVRNELSELKRITSFMEDIAREFGLGRDLLFQLNLVAEEVISNIILYGYHDNKPADNILIEITLNEGELKMQVTDHGVAFNPLSVPLPDDLNKPANERNVGGLGVYFVRQLMDHVEYLRKNDANVLVLTKNIS